MKCRITPEEDSALTEQCDHTVNPKWVNNICEMHYGRHRRLGSYQLPDRISRPVNTSWLSMAWS